MKNTRLSMLSMAAAWLIAGCAQPHETAKAHMTAKNYPSAIEAYKAAHQEEPSNGFHMQGLADAYYGNGQYLEAIEWYRKAKAVMPGNVSIACNLGGAYYYLGRYEESLEAFESVDIDAVSGSGGRDSRLRAMRGIPALANSPCAQLRDTAYEKTGRYDMAIARVKKQIDADPRQGAPFVKLADLYIKAGRHEDAVVAAKRSIDLLPASAEAHHALGAAYWKLKEYKPAIGSLQHARELNPKNATTAVLLAKSYKEVGEDDKAVETLRKAKTDAASAAVDLELARLLYRRGDYSESRLILNGTLGKYQITGVGMGVESSGNAAVVRSVTENSPAARAGIRPGDLIVQIDQQPFSGLGTEQIVAKLRGSESTAVKLTLKRGSGNLEAQLVRETFFLRDAAPVLALRALTNRKLGDLRQAQEDARKAYELDPAEANLAMAATAYERGDMAGTLRYASAAKEETHARILEGGVYARGGNTEKALELLRKVAVEGMDEGDLPVQEEKTMLLKALSGIAKARYEKGVEAEQSGRSADAAAAYADALLLAQSEEEARSVYAALFRLAESAALQMDEESHRHVVRGEFYVGEASFAAALTEFKKALLLSPFAIRLYYNTALVEANLERYRDALKHMRLYVEAAPQAPDARAAKDEMIKWEMLLEKPKTYPYYEGIGGASVPEAAPAPVAPAGGRGGIGR